MNKEDHENELIESFAKFAAEYPRSALSTITGLFVGHLEHSIKESGGDETLEIKIECEGGRDITISEKRQ